MNTGGKKEWEILVNGVVDTTVWSTSKLAAIAQYKRQIDYYNRPNFQAAVTITAREARDEEVTRVL
jgi:hypothetical protein